MKKIQIVKVYTYIRQSKIQNRYIRMQAEYHPSLPKQQLLNLNRVQNKPQPHHCGYCFKQGSCSWGLSKEVMHPYTYQMLAERGWRRCGTYYYKPDIQNSCCKLWTHRLDVTGFKIKKDQRKTIRNVVDWLIQKMEGNQKTKNKANQNKKNIPNKKYPVQKQAQKPNKQQPPKTQVQPQVPQIHQQKNTQISKYLISKLQQNKQQFLHVIHSNFLPQYKQQLQIFQQQVDLSKIKCFLPQPNKEDDCDFYSNFIMLLYGTNKKMFQKQYGCLEFVRDVKGVVEGWLVELRDGVGVVCEVERAGYLLVLDMGGDKMKKKLIKEKQMAERLKYAQMKQEQMDIQHITQKQQKRQQPHNKKPPTLQPPTDQTPKLQLSISSSQITLGPLLIQIVPAQVTNQSWRMYQRYCQQIHEKPQKSQSSYSGFLCQKGLNFVQQKTQGKCQDKYVPTWELGEEEGRNNMQEVKGVRTKMMGCYHMKYYIENQLIGVGVVDILPHGLSSVYFFYEPKYNQHRLGVFSSLIEIQYIRWLSLSFPQFKYYYMGFYIQNSQKMSYKGNYQPFHLLCPLTYKFIPFNTNILKKIQKSETDQKQSIQLCEQNIKIDDMRFDTDIGLYINQKVKFKYKGQQLKLKDLNPKILIPVLGMLRDMVQVWGKNLFQIFTFTF